MVKGWSITNRPRGRNGGIGAKGDAATITVGTVATGLPGSSVTIVNAGTSANAVFNFTIPRGNAGSNGTNGNAATIAAGTTTTTAPGTSAAVSNVGSSSAATFNFSIPRGDVGPAGPSTISAPVPVTPAFGTAYPATVPSKPSFVSAMIDAAYTVTVIGTVSDTVELRIGPVQAQVAAGTGGTAVASFRASVTGIALAIGLGIGQRNQLSALVPAGWFWAVRRVSGSTATITSATDQSLG